jgi:hypothetical protein
MAKICLIEIPSLSEDGKLSLPDLRPPPTFGGRRSAVDGRQYRCRLEPRARSRGV